MAAALTKTAFFVDLAAHIQTHETETRTRFQPLDAAQLRWKPAPKEWSILQCYDHLNQTHDYYITKITAALADSPPAAPAQGDVYTPSLWGRVYMFFALNPRFSFPAPAATIPEAAPDLGALNTFLENQQRLRNLLEEVERIDLAQTRIPIEKNVQFNLGDCLKILVYHDALHMRQATGVQRSLPQSEA